MEAPGLYAAGESARALSEDYSETQARLFSILLARQRAE